MEQNIECLMGGDLLPWERHYFMAFLRALESQMGVHVRDLSSSEPLARDARLWVIARDWRSALARLPKHHTGNVFVSVLGMRSARRWFGLLDRHWNPSPRLNVCLLTHSPYAYRFLREMERIPTANLVELPLPGFMADVVARSNGPLRVGCLAALTSDANLAFLVAVAHYVSQHRMPVRFHVPQSGALFDHLRAMIEDLKLDDYFAPLAEDQAMDVLLHAPLKSETFIPVLWQAAQGVPVLTSDVPGIEDLINDGHDGFVVPVNEVRPVGELIARLAENESLRRALGDRLRQGLAKRFPLDRVLEQYRAIFLPRVRAHQSAAA
jgi:glycosyltransferase involved in cell wall biosynthesis